ncbi:MAG: D-alanine--D-alanine ligase A [Candidatus Rokubacteria bacterium RIFCSPLOWO2_02_FULL_68_19]|nr:MAG: D-alanine--D-alanine ligase A [Candidatus Rokubacteria bacterium RIFCSPLOWO2_02_FULL_68_19]
MSRRIRVGVIFGGRSGEHEVSLASAASVLRAIDRSRFEPIPIGIAKDGRWLVGGDPLKALAENVKGELSPGDATSPVKQELVARAEKADAGAAGIVRVEPSESFPAGLRRELDVVMIMLHGPYGEDGTVQGLLELAGIPYVGAGVLASAAGMDKAVMKALFRAAGLPVVEHLVVLAHEWEREPGAIAAQVAERIGYPCFVKPSNLGSSVGISKVKSPDALPAAMAEAARHGRKLLVERAAQGQEIEVSVLGNEDPQASLPGEILYDKEWYDYEAKYGEGHTTLKVPAPVSPEQTRQFQQLAVTAFRAIDCRGMARVDFFLEGERILVNEINTIPGFTATSAYPRLWEASGLPYPDLIARLIDLALESPSPSSSPPRGEREG